MNKKICSILALTLVLASCGKAVESTSSTSTAAQKKSTPIKIDSASLGQTSSGFANDLNNVVEGAYQNAASGTTATPAP